MIRRFLPLIASRAPFALIAALYRFRCCFMTYPYIPS